MTCGIYRLIFNGTDKCYIGQSINIEKRVLQHTTTLKNNTASPKLQEAFNTYGYPTYEVLAIGSSAELDALEDEAIEIYNSVDNGFNTYHYANQAPTYSGFGSANSKYTKEQILEVLKLAGDTCKSSTDIEICTGVSSSTVLNILAEKSHLWAATEYPEVYSKAILNKSSREKARNQDRAIDCRERYSAEAKNIKYPPIQDINGNVYTVTCVQEFARIHNLPKSSLHRVLKREAKQVRGWSLCLKDNLL